MTLPRWLAPAVTGFVAAVSVLALTPDGAGLSNDSVSYVAAATDLDAGYGLTSPFTTPLDPVTPLEAVRAGGHVPFVLWPPGYPLALVVTADLGPSVLADAGRLLNALSLAVTAAATAVLARRAAGGIEAAAWLAPPLALAAAPVLQLHQFLLSDPLALALQSLALLAVVRALRRPSDDRLVAVALMSALVPMVRLAGLAVPIVASLALARWAGPRRRDRLRAGAVALTAVVPVGAWALWTRSRTIDTVRPVRFRVPPWVRFEEALARGFEWVVPAAAPTWLRVVVIGLTTLVLAAAARSIVERRRDAAPLGEAGRLATLLAGFVVLHVVVVVVSATVLREPIPIGGRLLVPIWPPSAVLLIAAAVRGVASLHTDRPQVAAGAARAGVAALVAVVALLGLDARDQLAGSQLEWTPPPRSADGIVVASNAPAREWLRTGHTVLVTPRRWADAEGEPHPRAEQEIDELHAIAQCRPTTVVLYDDTAFFSPELLPPDEVRAALADLDPVVEEIEGGVVLHLAGDPDATRWTPIVVGAPCP